MCKENVQAGCDDRVRAEESGANNQVLARREVCTNAVLFGADRSSGRVDLSLSDLNLGTSVTFVPTKPQPPVINIFNFFKVTIYLYFLIHFIFKN